MKNILFINPLDTDIIVISFVDGKITEHKISLPFLQFAEQFPSEILKIFQKNTFNEIWTISGPGAFTKMRIITLTINSIKFSSPNIILKSTSFFNICRNIENQIPILEANTTEFLIKNEHGEEIFIKKSSLPEGKYVGYIDKKSTNIDNFSTFINNFNDIQKVFESIAEQSYIQPIYIKPPHITTTGQKI